MMISLSDVTNNHRKNRRREKDKSRLYNHKVKKSTDEQDAYLYREKIEEILRKNKGKEYTIDELGKKINYEIKDNGTLYESLKTNEKIAFQDGKDILSWKVEDNEKSFWQKYGDNVCFKTDADIEEDFKHVIEKLLENATLGEIKEKKGRILYRLDDQKKGLRRSDIDTFKNDWCGPKEFNGNIPTNPTEVERELRSFKYERSIIEIVDPFSSEEEEEKARRRRRSVPGKNDPNAHMNES